MEQKPDMHDANATGIKATSVAQALGGMGKAHQRTHVKMIFRGPKEVCPWVIRRVLPPELWNPSSMLPAGAEEVSMLGWSVC